MLFQGNAASPAQSLADAAEAYAESAEQHRQAAAGHEERAKRSHAEAAACEKAAFQYRLAARELKASLTQELAGCPTVRSGAFTPEDVQEASR